MNAIQKAIFPGIIVGALTLVGLSKLVLSPLPVNAATEEVKTIPSSESCEYYDRYPQKTLAWCGLIEESSKKYNIDPLLIASIMLQESGGQPEILSGSGAVGLMQVMPRDGIASTFQCINGPCFSSRPTIQELKDPAFNVNYGVRMLAGLIERYGDIRESLKHYGPYDVEYQYADKVLLIRNGL